MKADKKAAEKESKEKDLGEQTDSNNANAQNASALDDETLDPNVRWSQITIKYTFSMFPFTSMFICFDISQKILKLGVHFWNRNWKKLSQTMRV